MNIWKRLLTSPSPQEIELLTRDSIFEIQRGIRKSVNGICHEAISFPTPWGDRAPGVLIGPEIGRSVPGIPGVLLLPGHPGRGLSLKNLARELAKNNIQTLIFDALPFRLTNRSQRTLEEDRNGDRALILEYRWALQVLRSLEEVDPSLLGVLGVSMGGIFGSPLAGLEHDVKAFLFQISVPGMVFPALKNRSVPHFLNLQKLKLTPKLYEKELALRLEYEGIRYTQLPRQASILWQNTTEDPLIPQNLMSEAYNLCGGPKEIQWYPGGHTVSSEMRRDGITWLIEKLRP